MTTSSAEKAAYGGLFTAGALIFSYAETFIPLNALIPVPGFKLGLANVCIMLAMFYLGTFHTLLITVAKCVLTALLFGTPVSFVFSAGGAVLSFLFLMFSKYVIKEKVSYLGISVACAALHNIGQVSVAALFFGDTSVFWYLEWLLPVSLVTGIITGALAFAFERVMRKKI